MKKILVLLLMVMPLFVSAQSTFTVESDGVKYSFPLEGTTITITDSSDDGNKDVPSEGDIKKKIVGSWRSVHATGWVYDDNGNLVYFDGDIPEDYEGDNNLKIVLDSEGKISSYEWYKGKWDFIKSGSYNISGDILTSKFEYDGEIEMAVVKILSISDDTFIGEGTLDEEGKYKQVVTYKRIKLI